MTTDTNNIVLSTRDYDTVGKRPIRHDGHDKVTGKADWKAVEEIREVIAVRDPEIQDLGRLPGGRGYTEVVVVEASRRIGDPPEVSGWGVLVLGTAGLLVNGGCALLLHRSADRSLNVRGAALHLMGDAAGSVGVVVAGVAVVLWSADWVDSAVSYLIAGLLLWTGAGLVRRTTRVLLEGAPPGIDVSELSTLITAHERVNGVHHLHVWSVDSLTVALSAHVEVAADSLHDAQIVATELERQLALRGVDHATLALECHPCDTGHPAHEHD